MVGDSVIVGWHLSPALQSSWALELFPRTCLILFGHRSIPTQFLNSVVLEVAETTLIASHSIILVGKLSVSRVNFRYLRNRDASPYFKDDLRADCGGYA